jgi:hypothetical protein
VYVARRVRPAPPAPGRAPVALAPDVSAAGRGVGGVVVLLGLTSLFTDLSSEMVAAVLPLFATAALGLSPFAYGAIDGLYHGVTALVRLAGGFAGDRSRRPKTVAAAGYGLSALCKLALLPVSGPTALGAVVLVDRAGKGLRTAPRDALVAAAAKDPRDLGRAFGVHRALDTVGALAGPLVAFALLAAIPGGFDAVFGVAFASALVGFGIIALLVPGGRAAAPAGPTPTPRRALALVREPRLARLLAGAALLSALSIGDGFLYLAAAKREDLAAEYFPLLFVGTALTYLLLAVPLGRLADRVGRLRVFLLGHVPLVGAYACAAGALPGTAGLLGCLLLLGAYYAATDGVLAAAAAAAVPADLRGSGLALAQTAVAAGRLLAALGFGAAWVWVGSRTALSGAAVALAFALPVAALLLRGGPRANAGTVR